MLKKKKKEAGSSKHTLYLKLHLFLDNERMISISEADLAGW